MTELMYYIISAIFDVAVAAILALAALNDAKTRIVRPSLQLSLFAIAVAHFIFVLGTAYFGNLSIVKPMDAWMLPISGALMFAIYITMVLIFKAGIGGADTKVTSTMALYLGLFPCLIMIISHFVAAIVYVVYEKVKNHRHIASVPLMVFIGIGYAVTLIVKWATILIQ